MVYYYKSCYQKAAVLAHCSHLIPALSFPLAYVTHQNISLCSPFILSRTLRCSYFSLSFIVNLSHSLSLPSLLLIAFLNPLIFSLLALPSPLRHQLYTHGLCFHGVSHRFWQSALETQDHFK